MTKPKVGDRYRLYCTGQDGADGTYEVTVDAVKRLATGVYRLGAVRPGGSDSRDRVEWYVNPDGSEAAA